MKDQTTKAARPGSQPVVDCLIDGISKLEQQMEKLKEARETIKTIQPAVDHIAFGDACGNIVVHWNATLNVHHSIFLELASLTKPSPGSLSDATHDGFTSIVNSINQAEQTVKSAVCTIKKNLLKQQNNLNLDTKTAPEGKATLDAQLTHEAPVGELTPSKRRKISINRREVIVPLLAGAARDQTATNESNGSGATSHRKLLEAKGKRDKVRPTAPAEKAESPSDKAGSPPRKAAGLYDSIYAIPEPAKSPPHSRTGPDMAPSAPQGRRKSFEDITDEVDAALRAKEEKRRLKKESKKRKRDSVASSIFDHSDIADAASSLPTSAPVKGGHEQPAKKKTRLEIGAGPSIGTTQSDKNRVESKGDGSKDDVVKRRRSSVFLNGNEKKAKRMRTG
ncbi:hypothetical protein AAFC00_000637 [Neodothiora populina]|uniref:Uncharacterized protein n=1 Tax=Neodothiora populina TaxID=2781224 RepID=A0ABR3PDM2_9PEZI